MLVIDSFSFRARFHGTMPAVPSGTATSLAARLSRNASSIGNRSCVVVLPSSTSGKPFHIFAQQLLALAVQEGRIGRRTWREWLGRMPAFCAMAKEHLDGIIEFMLTRGMLYEDGGMLSMGVEGERAFGRRHFMDLMSVFISEPLFSVQHGRAELGLVHPLSFLVRRDGPVVLLLAGRSWEVTHVDWDRRVAYVKATTGKGRSRWIGQGIPLSFDLCRAIRRVLDEGTLEVRLSRRARTKLDEIRGSFSWVDAAGTVIIQDFARTRRSGT